MSRKMNCFLSFHHNAAVPNSSSPEVSKAASEPSLGQYVNSRIAQQRTTFARQAQAKAACISARRPMSPALVNLAAPQVGHSTILRPRFFYPSAVDVKRVYQQDVQRQKTLVVRSSEQQRVPGNPQPSQLQQEHQQYRQEPSQKDTGKQGGLDNHTICRVTNANGPQYIGQQQCSTCLTASRVPSQHIQQLLSPATNQNATPHIRQKEQLKGAFKKNSVPEEASYGHQANPQASGWTSVFVAPQGATNTAVNPCIISPRKSTPNGNSVPSFLERPGSPSCCGPQLPRAPEPGTRAIPLQPRSFSVIPRDSSAGDGTALRDKPAVLHFACPEESREVRYGAARLFSSSINMTIKPPNVSTTEAVASVPVKAAVGVEHQTLAASDAAVGASLVDIAETSGRTAGDKVPSIGADSPPGQAGNALFGLPPSSAVPKQQVTGKAPHFWAQGFPKFTIWNNRASLLAMQRGGEYAQQHSSHFLRCRLPVDGALPKNLAATANTQLPIADTHFLQADTERRGTEEERRCFTHSCAADLPQVAGESQGVKQQQPPRTKLQSVVCDLAGEPRTADRVETNVVSHSRAAERATSAATRLVAGFALGRPRTPLRAPVPQPYLRRQSPRQPQLLQAQEHARRFSVIQEQLLLQQQLLQLQDQRPYSWASAAVPVGHGSPVLVTGNASKAPFRVGQIQLERHPHTSMLPNTLATCWCQPQSPRATRGGSTSPSTCSNGGSVARNQISCTLSANGVTCVQIQGQQQRLEKTSINRFHKRPTSAPPGKTGLPPQHRPVVQSHQHRVLASPGAVLASRRRIPWEYQSHHVPQQRNDHISMESCPLMQPLRRNAATPHFTSNLAFSSALRGAVSAASSPAAASVAAGQVSTVSPAALPVPVSYRLEERTHVPSWKYPRQTSPAKTGEGDVLGHLTTKQSDASSFAGAPGRKASLLAPAKAVSTTTAAESAARAGTDVMRKKSFPRSVDASTSVNTVSAQADGTGIAAPCDSKPRLTQQPFSCGSPPGFYRCEETKQNDVSRLLSTQACVGLTDGDGTVHKNATPQHPQQPPGITVSQDSLGERNADGGRTQEHGREGNVYKVKTGHGAAALVTVSAVCGTRKQQQDQLGEPRKNLAQFQQSSDDPTQHLQKLEQRGDWREEKRPEADQQHNEPLQRWHGKGGPLESLAVAPFIHGTLPRTRDLQNKDSANGLETEDIGIHTPTQAASVGQLEEVQHEERPFSVKVDKLQTSAFEDSCVPFLEPPRVGTFTEGGTIGTGGVSLTKGDSVQDCSPRTPITSTYTAASHCTAQDATVGSLTVALNSANSGGIPDRGSTNGSITSASYSRVCTSSYRAATSLGSTRESGLAAEVLETEAIQELRHEHVARAFPKSGAACVNVSADSVVRSAEVDARTNRSTMGSEGSGMDGGQPDAPGRCSQERSTGRTSSCCHTTSNRKSCPFHLHDSPNHPQRMVDANGDTHENKRATSSYLQGINSNKGNGSSCETPHAGSGSIHSIEPCTATTENVERRGSSDGGSTATSIQNVGLSEEASSDVDNEGKEDVIPLPSFLWRSPLSVLKNAAGNHNVCNESDRTTAPVNSAQRLGCRRSALQCRESSENEKQTYKPIAATKSCGNSHVVQRDLPAGGSSSNPAGMQLGDFELADPRFGGEASLLGRGTYGVVRLMRHKPTGRLYAVKSIEKSSVVEAGMVSQVEFELLTQKDVLRHRNVLRCHAFLEDVDRVHMILEYCSGGDLYTRIRTQPQRRISEQEAFLYFAQLVNGLHYMHTRCIMHRDLKLENLLLDKDGVLKIADLGWCTTILGKRRNFNFCGTLDYLAPEMIRGDGHDWRVDLWGAGILLYEMLDGKPPFQSTRQLELVQQILKAKISLPPHIPPDAGNLIEQLLQYDPEDRIPLHAICQHPWVKRMWSQLKRHYYSVYPNAAPAAFDLCTPDSTVRKYAEDGRPGARGNLEMLLNLREVYFSDAAEMLAPTDDGHAKSKKEAESPSQSTRVERHVPAAVSFSSPATSPATLQGLAVASSIATGRGDANSISPSLATTAGTTAAATHPCKTTAGVELAEARRGIVIPTAHETVEVLQEETSLKLDSKRAEMRASSCKSSSPSTSSVQQQRHREGDSDQISVSDPREVDPHGLPKKSQDFDAGVAGGKHEYAVSSNKTTGRASDGSPKAGEHPVLQRDRVLHRDIIDGCATVANAVWERQKEFRLSTSSATASEKKSRTRKATGSILTASPESSAGATTVPPPVSSELEHASARSAGLLQPASSAARAVTPPVAAARLLPRVREGRPVVAGTTAAPRRRTTATATTIRKLVEAAPQAALTSRAADTSPKSISLTVERSLTTANSLPHAQVKAKRYGAARRPIVIHQLSKIDSGLGSQKKILLSPPMKRSALRSGEPWEGTMSSIGDAEQSELDVTKSLLTVDDERRQQDSSAGAREDLQQPIAHEGLQPPTALPLTQQHLNHPQRPEQQQQVQHRNQQLPMELKPLENYLVEHGDVRQGHKLQQPVQRNEESLREPWQLQRQSQLQNHWNVEQQPLLHNLCPPEHDSAPFHELQPSSTFQQQRLSSGSDCSPVSLSLADTATETSHESLQRYHHYIQHLQNQKRAQQILMFPEQRELNPMHHHHLPLGTTGNLLLQNETVSQQVPLPPATWYLNGQRHETAEQQRLLLTRKPVGSGQQTFLKILAPQAISPHRHLLLQQQQHILKQQQQTFNRMQHFQEQQPPHKQSCSQDEYQHHYQQQQRRDQDQHMKSLSSKELAMNLACHSVQQQQSAILVHRTGPHQQSCGHQHYLLGYWHQRMRSVTPPAPSAFDKFRNAAHPVHSHSYHLAPNQQNFPWRPQASAYTRAQLVRPESRAIHLYNTVAPEGQPRCEELVVCSPACTVDSGDTSQAACRKAQSTSVSTGAASTDVAAAGTLHQVRTVVASSNEDGQTSCANGGTCYEEMSRRDAKRHRKFAPCGLDARAGGRAESTTRFSAATSADTGTVTKHQGTRPKRPCVPSSALHAYTPRWGRSQQAVTGRCATVAPPSSLSSVASTAHRRSLLAVSAPPRSFAASETARKHAHGLTSGRNLEQSRQRRPQAQQMRQQGRSETPAFSQQQQQPGSHEQTARALVGSPLPRQEMQQDKNDDCSRSGTTEADGIRPERLSCFSFGRRREINRRPHESNISNSDLTLFSDRLSGGSIHDVRLLSHRFNLPDTDKRGPSPSVSSTKARLALNKLFENATSPRPPRTSGARLLAPTLASRVRAAKATVAARASPVASVVGSRASGAPAAVLTVGSTVGMLTKPSTSSPKAACSLRQIGSHGRFHAQSPPRCGTAAAAVAVAAASWRARAAERESRERRVPAETSSRLGKMVGGNIRQAGCGTEDAGEGGQDSSSGKTGAAQIQGHFDMLGKTRVGAQASDASRKTQRLTDFSVRKATCTFPPKNPQTHAATGRQRQGAGERVRTYHEGEAVAPPRAPTTSTLTKRRVEDFAETNAEMHSSRNKDYTGSNNNAGDRSSSSINSCTLHRAPTRQPNVAADKRSNERSASPVSSNPSTLPRRETQLQQQSGPPCVTPPGAGGSQSAQSCLKYTACATTLDKEHPPVNHNVEEAHPVGSETGFDALLPHGKQSTAAVHGHQECAQGGSPYYAGVRSAKSFTSKCSTSPPSSTSPSKSNGLPSIFSSGQAPNTSSSLPGYHFAADAAVAAAPAAQQEHGPLDRKSACQRYWSPPSRDVGIIQWKGCNSSNSERTFSSRPEGPQLTANFATNAHAFEVTSGSTDNYGPANQQAHNTTAKGGAGGSSLTFSWTARERQMYNKRQQTPPPAAVSVAAREMRQGTPLSLGTSVGQYHPCHTLKTQVTPSVASMGGQMWSLAAAARGQIDHPHSLSGFWGPAAIAGVSAAASTAACHARLGPAHAHPSKGFGLLS